MMVLYSGTTCPFSHRCRFVHSGHFDANVALGLPVDAREYGAAAAILRDLDVDAIRLLSNNPAKERGLREEGVDVRRVGLRVPARPENARYLRSKRERMGHDRGLDSADHAWNDLLEGQVPPAGELAERYGPLVKAGDRLVIAQVFSATLAERIQASVFAENQRSRQVALKLGLTLDGVLRSALCWRGRRWDEAVYSILRSEWAAGC